MLTSPTPAAGEPWAGIPAQLSSPPSLLSQTCCSSPAWLPQCSWCPSSSNSVKSAAAPQSTPGDVTTETALQYTWNTAVTIPMHGFVTHTSFLKVLQCSCTNSPYTRDSSTPSTRAVCRNLQSGSFFNQKQVYFYNTDLYSRRLC